MDDQQLQGLRCELVKSSELWQFDVMDSRKLWQFASDRGVRLFNHKTIEGLWQVGLLRADAVTGDREIRKPHLEQVSIEDDGTYLCGDTRKLRPRKNGFGGALANSKKIRKDVRIFFHPFRLYVLYHIQRVFGTSITSTQYLLNPSGLLTLSCKEIERLDKWTSQKEFCDLIDKWNKTAELAIVCEPASYEKVFQAIRWRYPDTQETIQEKLSDYRKSIKPLIDPTDLKSFEGFRGHLCREAEILDRNKLAHIVLRLMSRHQRLGLRSSLGGAMVFLSMAEVIRRTFEDTLGLQMPEEDERGFGQWVTDARRDLFGTDRILDASQVTRRDFLTSMGLDFGVKVRCYVEGSTEIGALGSALDGIGGIEFINLRGQVIESKGKGLAFVHSLENDIKSQIFSIVIIDDDRKDYVRALRRAAENGKFFGVFFISSPDVEFENFTIEELVDVTLRLAAMEIEEVPKREELLSKVAGSNSASEFLKKANDALGTNIQKGEAWGEALMDYALEYPVGPKKSEDNATERQLFRAARAIQMGTKSGYARSYAKSKVDPNTGDLVAK